MRTVAVAIILALSLAFVAFPATGAPNDCSTTASTGQVCHKFEIAKPVPPPPAPGVPPQAAVYFDVYYIFFGGTKCTSPLSDACRGGTPPAAGSGVPTPAGTVGAGSFGVVFQETNTCSDGLQRSTITGCGLADRMILV